MKAGRQHGAMKRARGGDVYAGKDSEVVKEADEKGEGEKAKRGGRMEKKRAAGGGVQHFSEGGMASRRMDRPGRKRGGGVGSDKSPLTTANRTKDADGHSADEPETVS